MKGAPDPVDICKAAAQARAIQSAGLLIPLAIYAGIFTKNCPLDCISRQIAANRHKLLVDIFTPIVST